MPVLPAGRAPARMAYGIARVLAQAMPTPAIGRQSRDLSAAAAPEHREGRPGSAPARMAYGIASVLAQAMPTPAIGRKSRYLSSTAATEIRPAAPVSRHSAGGRRRPRRAARAGSADE